MDVLTLARVQFGATIAFHYIYPPLSIGLGVMLIIMEAACRLESSHGLHLLDFSGQGEAGPDELLSRNPAKDF